MSKKLSDEDFEKLKEHIFNRQRKYFKRNKLRAIKKIKSRFGRKETSKMLYEKIVIIDER